eukprot:scpid47668/ scgid23508/ 
MTNGQHIVRQMREPCPMLCIKCTVSQISERRLNTSQGLDYKYSRSAYPLVAQPPMALTRLRDPVGTPYHKVVVRASYQRTGESNGSRNFFCSEQQGQCCNVRVPLYLQAAQCYQ